MWLLTPVATISKTRASWGSRSSYELIDSGFTAIKLERRDEGLLGWEFPCAISMAWSSLAFLLSSLALFSKITRGSLDCPPLDELLEWLFNQAPNPFTPFPSVVEEVARNCPMGRLVLHS